MRWFVRFWTLVAVLAALPACDKPANRCDHPSEPVPCGGLAGIACPPEQVCVDDPRDDCDPTLGGADCLGICEAPPSCWITLDPAKTYYGNPDECETIRFDCPAGKFPFTDECGCGCVVVGDPS